MRHLLFAIVLAALASPARAQPAPWAPARTTAGWVFTPSIVFGGMWDTNVTVRNEGVPTTSELVGLLSPRSEIDFNGRRARFNAGYSGVLEAYRELDELTRYDQRGRLDARYQMTPRLLFQTRHQLTLTPTTDQLDLVGVPFTRVGSRMLTSSGGFTTGITRRMSLDTNYEFQWVDFARDAESSPDFVFLQGGHSHSPSAELKYAFDRRLRVGSLYMYRHTVIDGGEEIFGTHRAQGTIAYEVGPATTIHGRVGVDHVSAEDATESRTGPSYGGGFSHRVRQATFDGSYERAVVPSFGFGGLTASRVLVARAHLPFLQGRMFAAGSVTYRRSDPIASRGLLIQLDSYWTNASVGYFVARWLRMEGFYSFTHQFSSAQGNVDRTRIGIQFVTSKPMRIQ